MNNIDKNTDIFWLNNPLILAKTYLQFIPTKNMSLNQKYNAITLFSIYFLILT